MLRPTLAATLVALLLFAPAATVVADSEALDRAQTLLERDDGRSAVAVLEAALPGARAGDRSALLDALRQAYELAARQAADAGLDREAEDYRDNLRIINRKVGPKTTPDASVTAPAPVIPTPADPTPVEIPRAVPIPPEPAPPEPVTIEPIPEPKAPEAETRAPGRADAPTIADADAAFLAKRYADAEQHYAALAKANRLPEQRRDAWAYCRWYAVVRRINARPDDPAEWAAIHEEIASIRQLSPKNWFGEYLRNLAADLAPPGRKPRPGQMTVRGAAPEEPVRSRSQPVISPRSSKVKEATAPPAASNNVGQPGTPEAGWLVWETTNFRIFHRDEALAERAARAAESTRETQSHRWIGPAAQAPWTPRCDIYLYPTPALYSQRTGQPEDSPGYSRMGLNGGRVVQRFVHLRGDHPNLLTAILPHEVTHVILADLFPDKPIPKWADEGMAVLSEPTAEQDRRIADLAGPLTSRRLFKLADLMTMDYPDGQYWDLFYAQSVSLTRFLVERGTPAQFILFLQGAERGTVEDELRRVYQFKSINDLQGQWLAHAKSSAPAATARNESSSERK
ncbi:MAG: hypothetical protein ABI353_10360 [Isosphaeraceae bacterium]